MDLEVFAALGVSLAVGLLIGLERERAILKKEGANVLIGGVRTFPLIALVGSACALLGRVAPFTVPAGLIGLVALMGVHRLALQSKEREEGLTTETAALVTFLLGALAVVDDVLPVALGRRLLIVLALAVVVTLLLSVKPRLHAIVGKLSDEDIFATIQILVVAVIVLPLLPDASFGPFDAIEPRQIGKMILIVGAVSFNPTDFGGTSRAPLNRPRWRGFAEVHVRPFANWDFLLRVLGVGSSKASAAAISGRTITLAGYERIDVRAAWTPLPGFDVFFEVENLTNRDHREAVGFESPGIAPRVGVVLSR